MNATSTKNKTVYIWLIMTAVFWGFSFIGMKSLMDYCNSIEILVLRWTLSAIIFLGLILVGIIHIDWKARGVRMALLAGILEPGIYSILEIYGLEYTSASTSSIFVATIPCMTLIIGAVFFHRKTSKLGIFSILIAFSGVAISTLLADDASVGGTILGYILMMGAVVAGALYAFAAESSANAIDPIATTAVMAIFGALEFNIISLLMGNGFRAYAITFQEPTVALWVLFLGVCCSTLCYFGFNKVLQVLPPALTNNMVANSVTVIGVLGGILLLHDAWGWYTIVGLTLTLTGVILSSVSISLTNKDE